MLSADEFQNEKSLEKIFTAQVISVDTAKMIMRVSIAESFGVQDISVPVMYMSTYSKCGILAVPRKYDKVYVAMRQGAWVCIGFAQGIYNSATQNESGTAPTTTSSDHTNANNPKTSWSMMLDSDSDVTSNSVKPFPLQEGDYGIFFNDDKVNLEMYFLMAEKKIVLSAGTTTMVFDQDKISIKEAANYYLWTMLDYDTRVEFGMPRWKSGEIEETDDSEFLFRALNIGADNKKESIELGYVNSDGKPETNSNGSNIRARLKVDDAYITIGEDGLVEINTNSNVKINANSDIIGKSETLTIENKTSKIKTTTMNINAKTIEVNCDNCKVDADKLEIKSKKMDINASILNIDSSQMSIDSMLTAKKQSTFNQNVTIDGQLQQGMMPMALVTEMLLPILMSHTHPVSGSTATVSSALSSIMAFKTMTAKLT